MEKPQEIIIGCVIIAVAIIVAFLGKSSYSYLMNDNINLSCNTYGVSYKLTSDLNNTLDEGFYKYLGSTSNAPTSEYGGLEVIYELNNKVLQIATTETGVRYTRYGTNSSDLSSWT
jgi:hypothetical protein